MAGMRVRPVPMVVHALAAVPLLAGVVACAQTGSTASRTVERPAASVAFAEVPRVEARAFVVYDTSTSTVLADHDADARVSVGSLMKLLNAYVAYEAGDPDRLVTVPDGIGGEPGESVIGLRPGQQVSRAVLLRAMLKVSANDAARLLALDIAGSEEAYAARMNDAAAALGLRGTHAVNASGLDAPGQHATARDLIRLAETLWERPEFRRTVGERTARFDGQVFANTNDLLGSYGGADGIKTGHTSEAGYCLLASATRDGRRIVVAVLGAPSDEARTAAAATLLDWGFAQAGELVG